jgi:hypothetical protein
MPFTLPDATAPYTPASTSPVVALTRDELAALANPDDFRAALDALTGPIEAAARDADTEATAAVEGAPEFATLRDAGRAFREAWREYDAAARRIASDPRYTADGRDDARSAAAATRDAAIGQTADRVLSDTADALLRRFPATPVAPMGADLAAVATLLVTSAESMLPKTFLTRALDTLRRAADPETSPAERLRLNHLLDAAHLPLLERFSSSPPKHWGTLARVAARAAELTRQHLATAWGDAKRDAAAHAVEGFRSAFRTLHGMAREHGSWDAVYEIAAPVFRWARQ